MKRLIYLGLLAFAINSQAAIITTSGGGSATTDASQLTSGTLPDARLSSNVDLLNSTQTITGTKTFSNSIDMSSNKLTNLASGTSAGDSVAFSQVSGFRIMQSTWQCNASQVSIASDTFSGFSTPRVTLTPSSTSSKIFVLVVGPMVATTGNQLVTIFRGTTNIHPNGSAGVMGQLDPAVTAGETNTLFSIDSPSSASPTTYRPAAMRQSAGSGTSFINAGGCIYAWDVN